MLVPSHLLSRCLAYYLPRSPAGHLPPLPARYFPCSHARHFPCSPIPLLTHSAEDWNDMKLTFQFIDSFIDSFPWILKWVSEWASERVNKWAQHAGRRERMIARCERMRERMRERCGRTSQLRSEWPNNLSVNFIIVLPNERSPRCTFSLTRGSCATLPHFLPHSFFSHTLLLDFLFWNDIVFSFKRCEISNN